MSLAIVNAALLLIYRQNKLKDKTRESKPRIARNVKAQTSEKMDFATKGIYARNELELIRS